MEGYDVARLVDGHGDDDVSPAARQKARPWLLFGLALTVVGVLGAVVGTRAQQRFLSRADRLSRFHNSLLKAFSARALTEAANFNGTSAFVFAREGQEDINIMGVDISLSKKSSSLRKLAEEMDPVPGPQITIKATWKAIAGKSQQLAATLQSVFDAIPFENPSMRKRIVIGEHVDNRVVVTVRLPPPPQEEEEEVTEGAAEDFGASFTASLWAGRSFTEMYAHSEDSILLIPQGIRGHIDVSFANTVFQVMKEEMSEVIGDFLGGEGPHGGPDDFGPPDRRLQRGRPGPHGGPGLIGMPPIHPFEMLASLSRVKHTHKIRYRSDEALADASKGLPSFHHLLEGLKGEMRHSPPEALKAMKKLPASCDGLDKVEVTGLPNNYQIVASFTNFHLTPVLKSLSEEE